MLGFVGELELVRKGDWALVRVGPGSGLWAKRRGVVWIYVIIG